MNTINNMFTFKTIPLYLGKLSADNSSIKVVLDLFPSVKNFLVTSAPLTSKLWVEVGFIN